MISWLPRPRPRHSALVCGLAFALLGAPPVHAQCTAIQLKQLLASDSAAQDNLGLSIAIDGDTAVVGAWLDDNANGLDAGTAYVFQRDSGGTDNWGEVMKLVASDGATLDAFGWSSSISGDRIVVGAFRTDGLGLNRGAAYIFERNSGGVDNWGEVKILTASNTANLDQFGYSVAISGATVAVGAQLSDALGLDSGSAYVFDKDNGGVDNWGEVKELTSSVGAPGDSFGRSVAIDADTILVGSFLDDSTALDGGAAYIFERDNGGVGNWGESKQVLASDGASNDRFGSAVAISADLACVGAPEHDLSPTATRAGAAYICGRDNGGSGNWGETAKVVGSETSKNDLFGMSIDVDGANLLVGSYSDTTRGTNAGVAYVFGQDWGGANSWSQAHKLSPSDTSLNDHFGWSVALSGSTALSGATHNDVAASNAGAGYVFDLAGLPVNYCTAGISASGCQALLTSVGTPSATAPTGFTVTASGIEGSKDGLYFFSANGRQANTWGSSTSFQCVLPPVNRFAVIPGNGTNGLCDGTKSQDLNALWTALPAKNPGVGALVDLQLWYRDPFNTSNQTTSLSDALEFTICP